MRGLFALVLTTLLVTGCSSFSATPSDKDIEVTSVLVHLVPYSTFPDPNQGGSATWYTNKEGLRVCFVRLLEYPYFLGHEVDHCFRGKWHSSEPNSDDFK